MRFFFIGLISLFFFSQRLEAAPLQIDYKQSRVAFSVQYLYPVSGVFSRFEAQIAYDPIAPEKSSVKASIQAASVETGIPQRDQHLRRREFLHTVVHPRIAFESSSIRRDEQGRLLIKGVLTIRRIKADVEFFASVRELPASPSGQRRYEFHASSGVDRHHFNVTHDARSIDAFVRIDIRIVAAETPKQEKK